MGGKVPLLIADIRDYLLKYGAPPVYEKLSGKLAEAVEFDNETSSYKLKYRHLSTGYSTTLRFNSKVCHFFKLLRQARG